MKYANQHTTAALLLADVLLRFCQQVKKLCVSRSKITKMRCIFKDISVSVAFHTPPTEPCTKSLLEHAVNRNPHQPAIPTSIPVWPIPPCPLLVSIDTQTELNKSSAMLSSMRTPTTSWCGSWRTRSHVWRNSSVPRGWAISWMVSQPHSTTCRRAPHAEKAKLGGDSVTDTAFRGTFLTLIFRYFVLLCQSILAIKHLAS